MTVSKQASESTGAQAATAETQHTAQHSTAGSQAAREEVAEVCHTGNPQQRYSLMNLSFFF